MMKMAAQTLLFLAAKELVFAFEAFELVPANRLAVDECSEL
jgi:hypothetical protein